MSPNRFPLSSRMNRRGFLALGAGAAAAATLAACSKNTTASPSLVQPDSDAVRAAEAARRTAGAAVRDVTLRAEPTTVDLGGVQVPTWAFGGAVPGPEIRIAKGDVVRAQFTNALPAPTTIHWHGIALRNDMDGVPDVTQSPIAAGGSFGYEFTAPEPGTYFFHPHVGVQLDRGLYAPLIVEDPADGRDYDTEAVVVLDDWLDGVNGRDPDEELRHLRDRGMSGMNMGGMPGMNHSGMNMGGPGGMSMPVDPNAPLGSDVGDVTYPYFLINGRLGSDPAVFTARPGQRMRLRIINAAADSAFRVAVGGHQMRVTHTDGFPVQPITTSSLLISMGERYDVIVDLADGVFPLVAAAEGKTGRGFALIRTGGGTPPPVDARPSELAVAPLTADRLTCAESVRLQAKKPDQTLDVTLGSDAKSYVWTINGKAYPDRTALNISQGQRIRLRFRNQSMMFHPMHLHGHTFQLVDHAGSGPRKDTAIVLPMQTVEVDLDADNPGQWMLHCHNAYHAEAGMMSILSYVH
ncbi:multicopper oxidase family protein [Nocardia aurantiaca]|uniref:Multicopper oxidase domain-containing protein n=1 Tax=Nocardia aurantiaca TaxID=2675850 RepID=A0A6I3L5E8_9NOCA|nr:multicopper oxidase family protein [Nocardia aurantiaca]MTE15696.1 multicopper oxidase domain-containing protein [Nocardia aurantiaca]